jgi:LCP family protein required for cell wall assembly
MSSEQVESVHQDDNENQTMSPEDETDPTMPNLGDLENQFTTAPTAPTAPSEPVEPSVPESSVDSSEPSEPSVPTTEPTEPPVTEPPTPMGDIVNILLVGQDRRPGENRARSDSMILVTFNKTTREITLTSFLRDSYVQIPGYKPHKLCHAFQYGGMSLLSKTLNVNFGVEVDGAISVDFSQFEQIIDYLGGVDIKLTQKEADFMNNEYGLSVEPGMQRLTGKEALCYSRIRKIDTDYRRAGRQRKVLLSLVERYKSLTVEEMLDMLEAVLPMITTNIPKEKIVPLAMELFPMLGTCEFKNQQIPAEGTFIGGDVKVRPGLKNWFEYNIDFEENRRILQEIFDAD